MQTSVPILCVLCTCTSRHFKQGEGASREVGADCENFSDLRFQLYCKAVVTAFELVNTHREDQRSRATRGFTVSLSVSSAGPWTAVHSGELEDSRQQQDPLPLQTFSFSGVYARFVKFEITSCYDVWGGLQYFNVVLGKLVVWLSRQCVKIRHINITQYVLCLLGKSRRIEICSSNSG